MQVAIILSCVVVGVLAPYPANANDIPDAFSVEWQGKKPCESLFEDDKIRVLRCTFEPTGVHVRRHHPANLVYTLSGGKVRAQDAQGTRERESKTDAFSINKPIAVPVV